MQCLEFHRRLLVNPEICDAAIREHFTDCAACSRWAAKSRRFEFLLRQAMLVEVPENLAARILLRQAFRHPQRRGVYRRAVTLAASVVITAILAGALLWIESKPTLADDVFEHIDETSYSLTSTTILDGNTVAGVFNWFGADLSSELGDVSFANVCSFRGNRVAHVVLQNIHSPVTVIIMPGEQLDQPQSISAGSRDGVLLPYARGSMAVVSERGQSIDELQARLRNSIRWPRPAM